MRAAKPHRHCAMRSFEEPKTLKLLIVKEVRETGKEELWPVPLMLNQAK